jgi:hypothetical protein
MVAWQSITHPHSKMTERTMTDHIDAHATPKEEFDVLYATLHQLHEGLIEFEFRNGALLFLVLGWLLTAVDAHNLLRENLPIRLAITIALSGLTLLHAMWVHRHYVRSVAAHRLLLKLSYVPESYLEPRRIHKGLALSFGITHAYISLWLL